MKILRNEISSDGGLDDRKSMYTANGTTAKYETTIKVSVIIFLSDSLALMLVGSK